MRGVNSHSIRGCTVAKYTLALNKKYWIGFVLIKNKCYLVSMYVFFS